ncbi:hypothetical protein HMPREF1548_01018 [Clostridium sp. KLE 1755]|nr:hypothetical protein HMPREF1548_01018 [Clostridium sp. KLE 1755]
MILDWNSCPRRTEKRIRSMTINEDRDCLFRQTGLSHNSGRRCIPILTVYL